MATKFETTTRKYVFGSIQKITVSGTSAASTAVGSSEVLLHATTNCFINLSGAATSNHFPLNSGEKFHLQISPGDTINVIQETTGGSLFVIPVY